MLGARTDLLELARPGRFAVCQLAKAIQLGTFFAARTDSMQLVRPVASRPLPVTVEQRKRQPPIHRGVSRVYIPNHPLHLLR